MAVFFLPDLFPSVQGTVKGVVTDKQGNPLEDVQITIVSLQYSAVKYTLKSNKKGEFIQIGLQPDVYQIKAEKDGYFPWFTERRVQIMDVVEVAIEMEEGKYFIGESPGEKDFREGNDYFQQGNFEAASAAYREAIAKEPGEPIYYNNLGISLTKIGKTEEAVAAFEKMLELQPESYSANRSLGDIYANQKMYLEALPYFKKAAELAPQDANAQYDLGACLVNTQEYGQAIEAFSKAVSLKPDFAQAHYQLGMVYVNQNMKTEAIQSLEKFLELAPEDANATIAKQILTYLKSS